VAWVGSFAGERLGVLVTTIRLRRVAGLFHRTRKLHLAWAIGISQGRRGGGPVIDANGVVKSRQGFRGTHDRGIPWAVRHITPTSGKPTSR